MEQHHTGPLVMPATARRLERLAQQGVMNPRTLERALEIIGYVPSGARWLQFLDRSLLILGAGFAVSGVFYFFAFNWAALHRFVKLGLSQDRGPLVPGTAWRDLDQIQAS